MLHHGLFVLALVLTAPTVGTPTHSTPRPVDADPFATALAHFRRGEIEAAKPLLETAIAKEPLKAHLHLYLAFCRTRLDDRRAFESYRKAAELAPQDPEMHYQLGLALSDDGRAIDAATALERAVKLRPDWTDARIAWAYALEMSSQADRARTELDVCVRTDPDEPRAYLARAQCHYRAKRFTFALDDARETVRLAKEDGLAQLWLGICLAGNNKNEEAVVAVQDALEMDPELLQSEDARDIPADALEFVKKVPGRVEVSKSIEVKPGLMPAGSRLSPAGRRKAAIPGAPLPPAPLPTALASPAAPVVPTTSSVVVAPASPSPVASPLGSPVLGERAADRLTGAAAALIAAPSPAPASPGSGAPSLPTTSVTVPEPPRTPAERAAELAELVRSGNGAQDAGEHDEAIATFKRAVALDPNSVPAQLGLGIALHAKSERDASTTALQRVLEVDAKNAQAHYYLGANYGDAGQHDQAVTHYREAIRLQPGHLQALVGLGISLSEKGLHEEAIASYREAIGRDATYPEAHYHLGVSLSSADRDPEAVLELKEAIKLDPGYPDPHYTLGVIYHNANKSTDALREYQILKDLDEGLAHELYRTIYPE